MLKRRLLFFILLLICGFSVLATKHEVSNVNNTGVGSLRNAIGNSLAGDTIYFSSSLLSSGNDTITLNSEIVIDEGVTIQGLYTSGDTLFISGNNSNRIFRIDLSLSSMKSFIADGLFLINGNSVTDGGAIYVESADSVVLENCFIQNCKAPNGGAIYTRANTFVTNTIFLKDSASQNGGAIYLDSVICYLSKSSLTNNFASNNGGAVYLDTSITISQSTLAYNSATQGGSAIYAKYFNLVNSTVYKNSTSSSYGAIHANQINIEGSIIGLNDSTSFTGGTVTSNGYNLLSDSVAGLTVNDLIGVDSSQIKLVALTTYGTYTISLVPDSGSLAINNGNPYDQTSAQNGPIYGCRRDIGALEYLDTLTICNYISETACDSLVWGGNTLDSSDVYYDSLTSASGADSILVLDLVIQEAVYNDTFVDVCKYYIHNSDSLTESGIYSDTLTGINGCDSIYSLNLTVWGTVVRNTLDTGFGSLRKAVFCACEGDTVSFDTSMIALGSSTILLSSQIEITKSLVVKGLYSATDSVIISGTGTNRIFKVDLDTSTKKTIVFDSLILINGRATNNDGAGIHLTNTEKFTLTNSVIRGNGVIRYFWLTNFNRGGGIYCIADTLILSNNKFHKNNAWEKSIGAGLYAKSKFVVIDDCIFSENGSGTLGNNYGGGIYLSSSDSAIISNCRFDNNIAGYGGGIACDSTSMFMYNDSLAYNSSFNGGGIHATNSKLFINNTQVAFNSAISFSSTTLYGKGGGIYTFEGELSLDSCLLNSNKTNTYGGGIHAENSSLQIVSSQFLNDTAKNGGAIYMDGEKLEVINSLLSNNFASDRGGGIYVSADTSTVYLCVLTNNSSSGGSAIYRESGAIKISNSLLENNNGGSTLHFLNNDGRITVDSCSISNNLGSAIYNASVYRQGLDIKNTRIDSNQRGIYSQADSLIIFKSSISHNAPSGGITHQSGPILIDSSKINYNVASAGGGGLALTTAYAIISNTEIKNNSSNDKGGALNLFQMHHCSLVNCDVSKNDSKQGGGGIASFYGDSLNISNCTFDDNKASSLSSSSGGAIYTYYEDLNVDNSTFSNNSATSLGGAIYIVNIRQYWSTKISESTISSNSAFTGGGVYFNGYQYNPVLNNYRVQIVNSTLANNSASLGSAFYGSDANSFSVKSSIIANNDSNNISSTTSPAYSSLGYNIFSDSSAGFISTDQLNVSSADLKLSALGYYGGSTKTFNLELGSTAINTGTPSDFSPAQNSVIYDTRRDVGATERYCFVLGPVYTIDACGYYNFFGDSFTSSGSYYDTLTTVSLCDSIITLHLSIVDSFVITHSITTCDNYIYELDTIKATGIYKYTFTSLNGCDSIVYVDLTLSDTLYSYDTITICDSYIYKTDTFSNSGLYSDTSQTVKGCDSISFVKINILKSNVFIDTISSCQNYIYRGDTLVASGLYIDSFTNQLGCDSLISLQLTILPILYTSIDTAVCDYYVHLGDTLFQSGVYIDTLMSSFGCDSTVDLKLNILSSTSSLEELTSCDSLLWHGDMYYTSGTYIDTIVNTNGCDSVVTMNLTILTVQSSIFSLTLNTTSCDDSLVISANAFDTYLWNSGDTSQSTVLYSSGYQTVTVTDFNGCSSLDSVDVTLFQSPVFSLGNDTAFCGDSVLLTAFQGNSFYWSTGDTIHYTTIDSTGSYSLLISDSNGCTASDTVYLTLLSNISTPILTRSNDTITSGLGGSHIWFRDNEEIINETDSFILINGESGAFRAINVDSNGCLSDTSNSILKTLGIQRSGSPKFNVFPVPANGTVNIELGQISRSDIKEIRISDAHGRIIESTVDYKDDIAAVHWDSVTGIYWLTIYTVNSSFTARIVNIR
jgi:predicted outer membrane repeat protein